MSESTFPAQPGSTRRHN